MAPKSPLTPSLRVRPEGLPTWSRPEGPDRGLALAGCPSVPRSRRSASRLPARPKVPRLPTSTAEAAWPFRLRSGPEGPVLRLKRRSPEGFRRFRDRLPCGRPSRESIVLRACRRSNKNLWRLFGFSVDNQTLTPQILSIFSTNRSFRCGFLRCRAVDKVIPKKFSGLRKAVGSNGGRSVGPGSRPERQSAPHAPARLTSARPYSGWCRLRTSCSIANRGFFARGATMSMKRYWSGLSSAVTRLRSASAR